MPAWITTTLQLLTQLSVPAIDVTVILAALGARRRTASAAADRRRAVVVQVLDNLDAMVRRQQTPWAWLFPTSGIEWALVYPRLVLELDPRDEAITGWLWRQVQRILLEPDEQKQIAIASRIGGQVLGWQQGTITAEWFKNELKADPIQQSFAVPGHVQRRRQFGIFRTSLKVWALLFAGRWAWNRGKSPHGG